jgi:hypothetical protein
MEIKFTKKEMVNFLIKLNYDFKEVSINWKKEVICHPSEIPWENFSSLKKDEELLIWKLENTFEREFKHRLLKIWKY